MGRPAAWLVDNILKGTMPGEIPVEQPTTLKLRINRKVADALGLMFPNGLPSVIERTPLDAVDDNRSRYGEIGV
jgi:ABC-type uncharacterized transport system substrate-binding protein